jgi:hypothetical protein
MTAWLAWSVWGVSVALGSGAAILVLHNEPASAESILRACFVPGFATVGAAVAARRGRAVGWLLLGLALVAAAGAFSAEYAVRAYVTAPGSLPAGWLAAWAMDWLLVVLVAAFGLVLLLFPDGRLPSPGWRPVAWGLGGAFGLMTLAFMVRQPIEVSGVHVTNPLGVDLFGEVGARLRWPVIAAAAGTLLAAGLAPFWRWRRAGYAQRQQLKWLALVAAVACVSLGLMSLSLLVAYDPLVWFVVFILALSLGMPAAVGIAILRHGLYDIDRLLNRTVVYGLLTAALGVCYGVGSLGYVLVVGFGAEAPSWLVAGSTLAATLVFRPARRRIQAVVDRRFNRRKYDAARTIEAFSSRLRDHIDLAVLTGDLVAVVDQTMEPTTVSLWLRPAPARP